MTPMLHDPEGLAELAMDLQATRRDARPTTRFDNARLRLLNAIAAARYGQETADDDISYALNRARERRYTTEVPGRLTDLDERYIDDRMFQYRVEAYQGREAS